MSLADGGVVTLLSCLYELLKTKGFTTNQNFQDAVTALEKAGIMTLICGHHNYPHVTSTLKVIVLGNNMIVNVSVAAARRQYSAKIFSCLLQLYPLSNGKAVSEYVETTVLSRVCQANEKIMTEISEAEKIETCVMTLVKHLRVKNEEEAFLMFMHGILTLDGFVLLRACPRECILHAVAEAKEQQSTHAKEEMKNVAQTLVYEHKGTQQRVELKVVTIIPMKVLVLHGKVLPTTSYDDEVVYQMKVELGEVLDIDCFHMEGFAAFKHPASFAHKFRARISRVVYIPDPSIPLRIDNLAPDALLHIMSFLSSKEICALSECSITLRYICGRPPIWRMLSKREHGIVQDDGLRDCKSAFSWKQTQMNDTMKQIDKLGTCAAVPGPRQESRRIYSGWAEDLFP